MNKDNFLRLANVIELEDRFNLKTWATIERDGRRMGATSVKYAQEVVEGASCNTTACICGWANSLMLTEPEHGITPKALNDREAACRWLGIAREQAEDLFYPDGAVWVGLADQFGWQTGPSCGDDDCTDCELEVTSQITATQAAKVLRMIAEGEVEL